MLQIPEKNKRTENDKYNTSTFMENKHCAFFVPLGKEEILDISTSQILLFELHVQISPQKGKIMQH